MSAPSPLLELRGVGLRDADRLIFDQVSFAVAEREVVAAVLQHGAGKSALLRIAAGLMSPSHGEVWYRGAPIEALAASPPQLGFVFEDDGGMLANLSVYENLALPLRYHFDLGEAGVETKVREVAALVGLTEHLDRMPYEVTRDQQRLAALARAIAYEPSLIFVDELYAAADHEASRRLKEAIAFERDTRGTAFLVVVEGTHELLFADRYCFIDATGVVERARRG